MSVSRREGPAAILCNSPRVATQPVMILMPGNDVLVENVREKGEKHTGTPAAPAEQLGLIRLPVGRDAAVNVARETLLQLLVAG